MFLDYNISELIIMNSIGEYLSEFLKYFPEKTYPDY